MYCPRVIPNDADYIGLIPCVLKDNALTVVLIQVKREHTAISPTI